MTAKGGDIAILITVLEGTLNKPSSVGRFVCAPRVRNHEIATHDVSTRTEDGHFGWCTSNDLDEGSKSYRL